MKMGALRRRPKLCRAALPFFLVALAASCTAPGARAGVFDKTCFAFPRLQPDLRDRARAEITLVFDQLMQALRVEGVKAQAIGYEEATSDIAARCAPMGLDNFVQASITFTDGFGYRLTLTGAPLDAPTEGLSDTVLATEDEGARNKFNEHLSILNLTFLVGNVSEKNILFVNCVHDPSRVALGGWALTQDRAAMRINSIFIGKVREALGSKLKYP